MVRALPHAWEDLMVCCIQSLKCDYFLLKKQFDIIDIASASSIYLAESDAVEIKVENIDCSIASYVFRAHLLLTELVSLLQYPA